MSQHRHKLVSVIVALAMLVIGNGLRPSLVYAIPCGINCLNVTNAPTAVVTLNGTNQTVSDTLTLSVDNTLNLGWNVTITSTQFKTGSTPTRTLPTTASSITGVTAVCTAGQVCLAMPQNAVTYPVILPAGNPAPSAVKFYDAQALSGIGTFDLSTTIHITVPANAYTGSYTSTITLAFVNGP